MVDCRFCGGSLAEFVDLGMSPLCESYPRAPVRIPHLTLHRRDREDIP